jgi:5,6-dimethylbenzimidazole synthase
MMGPVFDGAFRARLDELFHWRRDVRRFQREALPEGMVERLLAVANGAPSVGLSQPWRFVLVDDPGRRVAVRANFEAANAAALGAQAGERAGVYARLKLAGLDEAPVHLAVCVDPDPAQGGGLGRATQPEMTAYSAVLAVHTLWLAARAEGVGVGWVSILDPGAVLGVLDLPACWRLVAYLCIGWPQEDAEVPELEREGWAARQGAEVIRR